VAREDPPAELHQLLVDAQDARGAHARGHRRGGGVAQHRGGGVGPINRTAL